MKNNSDDQSTQQIRTMTAQLGGALIGPDDQFKNGLSTQQIRTMTAQLGGALTGPDDQLKNGLSTQQIRTMMSQPGKVLVKRKPPIIGTKLHMRGSFTNGRYSRSYGLYNGVPSDMRTRVPEKPLTILYHSYDAHGKGTTTMLTRLQQVEGEANVKAETRKIPDEKAAGKRKFNPAYVPAVEEFADHVLKQLKPDIYVMGEFNALPDFKVPQNYHFVGRVNLNIPELTSGERRETRAMTVLAHKHSPHNTITIHDFNKSTTIYNDGWMRNTLTNQYGSMTNEEYYDLHLHDKLVYSQYDSLVKEANRKTVPHVKKVGPYFTINHRNHLIKTLHLKGTTSDTLPKATDILENSNLMGDLNYGLSKSKNFSGSIPQPKDWGPDHSFDYNVASDGVDGGVMEIPGSSSQGGDVVHDGLMKLNKNASAFSVNKSHWGILKRSQSAISILTSDHKSVSVTVTPSATAEQQNTQFNRAAYEPRNRTRVRLYDKYATGQKLSRHPGVKAATERRAAQQALKYKRAEERREAAQAKFANR